MQVTAHMMARMNQRGMKKDLVDLALNHGEVDGDRYVLSRRACLRALEELRQRQKRLEHAAKKGGVTVVAVGDTLITTYRTDGVFTPARQKSRG